MSERVPSPDALPHTTPASRRPLPEEILVERFEPGIVLCELPTPYRMGSTNCWLIIGDEDVLCVDPGADPDLAVERIRAALAPYGRTVDAIDTIVVTHTHPDHCGAAAGLSEIADAKVAVGALEVDAMVGRSDPPAAITAAWRGLGAPPDEVGRAVLRRPSCMPVASERVLSLEDGTRLRAGGRWWDVHVVGGHSPGHLVLVSDGVLLAGDHLLANVLPAVHFGPAPLEPVKPKDRGQDGLPWAESVAELLRSMERFEEARFEAITVLPGHGAAFRGTARPVERLRRYHGIRCEIVAARLRTRGPTTVWDLAVEMYPGLMTAEGVDGRFASAAAEVAGRLEALHQAGRATRAHRDGVVVFAST